MDLNNFYTGFGILLVYFTLIWQNNRAKGVDNYHKVYKYFRAFEITGRNQWVVAKKANKDYLINIFNITIDIISIAGTIAFSTLIYQNFSTLTYSVSSIVLFSITIMHLVISIDIWQLNIKLLFQIVRICNILKNWDEKSDGQKNLRPPFSVKSS